MYPPSWMLLMAAWCLQDVAGQAQVDVLQGHGECSLARLHVAGGNQELGDWSVHFGGLHGTITHNSEDKVPAGSESGHWEAAVYYRLKGCGATDENGKPNVKRTYVFHSTPSTFEDAVQSCKSKGANLAFPSSEDEAKALIQIFSQHRNISDKDVIGNQARIGAFSPLEDGHFLTHDGEAIKLTKYTRWAQGQPDNYLQEENCVAMLRQGLLNDVPCWLELPFICEK